MNIESTKQFTISDCIERIKKPLIRVDFEIVVTDDDFLYEDTATIKISAPRLVFNVLRKAAEAAKITPDNMASEWLSDTAVEIIAKNGLVSDEYQDDIGKDKWMKLMRDIDDIL